METESLEAAGIEMHALAAELFPICRSITGEGIRTTLRRLSRDLPLQIHEIPSGTEVFDWTVPDEWNIREAWIKNPRGNKVLDFENHNLHVVGYSTPVSTTIPLSELKAHLFTLPGQPDLIPYRTSYYQKSWGFCLAQNELERWDDGDYEVCIDSTLIRGSLTYGECFLPGTSSDEMIICSHTCHPSLANDNLSGLVVATRLADILEQRKHRLSYRFLFAPGTIGSITWLALNQPVLPHIKHGLVITCVGDAGTITYKESRHGNAVIDRAARHVLAARDPHHHIRPFHPYGYDERQFGSPGINLPVGCLMRSPAGTFPEYHTSADNMEFIQPAALADTLEALLEIIDVVEHNEFYRNLKPMCEPRLGKYGLYGSGGGQRSGEFNELALLWVLNQSDGNHDLLAIADRADMHFSKIHAAATKLEQAGLLEKLSKTSGISS